MHLQRKLRNLTRTTAYKGPLLEHTADILVVGCRLPLRARHACALGASLEPPAAPSSGPCVRVTQPDVVKAAGRPRDECLVLVEESHQLRDAGIKGRVLHDAAQVRRGGAALHDGCV